MSFRDCLSAAALRGLLKENKLSEGLGLLDDLERELRAQGMDAQQAADIASARAAKVFDRQAKLKKIQAAATIKVTQRILADFNASKNWNEAALDLWERGPTNYVARYNSLKGMAQARMSSVLQSFAPQKAGFYHPTDGLDDLLDALYGGTPKNKVVAEMAEGFRAAESYLVNEAQVAGAAIEKIKNYIPQHHSAQKIVRVTPETYARETDELLDWAVMEARDGIAYHPERRRKYCVK